MKPNFYPGVKLSMPQVQIKGGGSAVTADRNIKAITRGLEGAVQSLVSERKLKESLHLDRLHLRLPAGASEQQIADAIKKAVAQSMETRGDQR